MSLRLSWRATSAAFPIDAATRHFRVWSAQFAVIEMGQLNCWVRGCGGLLASQHLLSRLLLSPSTFYQFSYRSGPSCALCLVVSTTDISIQIFWKFQLSFLFIFLLVCSENNVFLVVCHPKRSVSLATIKQFSSKRQGRKDMKDIMKRSCVFKINKYYLFLIFIEVWSLKVNVY
jgi:hypothetical protein